MVRFIETERKMVVVGAWGQGGMGGYCLEGIHRVSVLQDEVSSGDGWW